MQEPFFLKIGLGNPVFPNSCEESLELGGRKRPRAGEGRKRNETENYWKNPSHEIIDISPFGPNLCLKISVPLPPAKSAYRKSSQPDSNKCRLLRQCRGY